MIEKDDVFTVEDKLYVAIDLLNYNGHEYCLCNEMQDEKTFGPKSLSLYIPLGGRIINFQRDS